MGEDSFEFVSINGSVADNDSDPDDGAVLTYALDVAVAGLDMAADGSWTFDPNNAAYAGQLNGAPFELVADYTVTDEFGAFAQSTLTITADYG